MDKITSPLAAYGMASDAAEAPESLAELMETSRLLRIAPELLATQGQEQRCIYLARALAANPGLMRFASQGPLNRSIALAGAGQGRTVAEAFTPLARTAQVPQEGERVPEGDVGPNGQEEWEPGEEEGDEEEGDWTDLAWLDTEGADYFELSGGDVGKAASLDAGKVQWAGNEAVDYVLDPFRNFANGWLDLLSSALGTGKSAADLAAGRDSALSAWFGKSLQAVKELEFPVRRAEGFGSRLAQDVVRNTPQLLSQVGTWLTAGPAAAMGLVFSHIYGSDYLRHTEKGISPLNSAVAAALDASLQSLLEKAGLNMLLKAPGLGEFVQGMGKGAARQLGLAAARGAAIEGATEAAQYAPEYVTSWWAESSLYNNSLSDRLDWTLGRALDARNLAQGTRDALYEGLVGAILGAPVAAGHTAWLRRKMDPELVDLLNEEKNMAQAVVRRLALEDALEKARQAVGGMADPEQARLVALNSLPENMRSALLRAGDLSQILARDPRRANEILQASGRTVEEINVALDSGADLEIDLASLLVRKSPEARLIQEALRLDGEGPSLGMARAWSPEQRLQEVLRVLNQEDELEGFSDDERVQARAEEAHALKSISGRVDREIRRLVREMSAAGLSGQEAENNAALLRAHALTWWKRYGMDGSLLLGGLKVARASRAEDGRVLDGVESEAEQAGPTEPRWIYGDRPGRKAVLRGQLALGKSGAIIRLFHDRDISTVSHESGHLFLQDLLELAQNGEERVRENLLDETAALCGEDLDFASELSQELQEIKAANPNESEALREYAKSLLKRAAHQAELARKLEEGEEERMKAGGEVEFDPAVAYAQMRADIAKKLARKARDSARWLEACQDAGGDLEIFAQHAGLDAQALARASQAALDLDISDPALLGDYSRLHEYVARAFTSYLAEGRAPSPKLTAVLARFRAWLSALWSRYRDAPTVALTPDLRAAFDRLLASDQDMRVQEGVDAFARHERVFLDDERLKGGEARDLRALLRRAQANALNRTRAALRKRDEKWRKQRAAQLYRELENDPFWLLAEKGRFRLQDVESILGEGRAAALREAWPVLFSKKGGSLAEAAAEAGYADAGAMLEEIYERLALRHESRRVQAELMAQEELEQRRESQGEPLPVNPDLENYLKAAEDAVAHIAARAHLENEGEIERWVYNSHVPQSVIDSIAATRLANTPIRNLNPKSLERMLNSVLGRRDKLLASGKPADLMRALNEASEARVIYAMMQDAARARRLLAKVRDFGRKLAASAPGSYPARHTEALRQILAGFGLGTLRAPLDLVESRRSPGDLLRDIMESEDLGDSLPAFPDWLLELRHPDSSQRNYNGVVQPQFLSPTQLGDLHNLLKFLDKSGRGMSAARKNSEASLLARIAESCVNAMEKLPNRPRQRPGGIRDFIDNLARKGFTAVDILLWQARKADGMVNTMGKGEMGEFEKLWAELVRGEERVRGWLDKVHRAMAPHLEQLARTRERLERQYGKNMRLKDLFGRDIETPAAWQRAYRSKFYTPEMIVSMALHLGNASNMERLISSFSAEQASPIDPALLYTLFGETRFHGLKSMADPENLTQGSAGLLTPKDWKAIQGIWDALSLLWPDTRRVHNEMYNFSPEMVPRQSFEIWNGDGTSFRLDGGYFPVRYDPRVSEKVANWSEKEELQAINEAMFIPPSAKRGHTRERVKKAPGLPLRLDLSPIGEHVLNAARFIELAQVVRRMDRVHRRADFRNAYINKYGQEDYEAIRPNLRGLLRTERLPDVIAWLESKMRQFVVPWGLSLNLNVALIQSTAILPAMGDLGAAPVFKAMKQLLLHPSLRKDIWKASPYMYSRMQNLDQDLVRQIQFTAGKRPASIKFRGKNWSYQDLVDLGMKGIIIVDAAATCTVWLAAYQSKLAELRATASPSQNSAPSATPAELPNAANPAAPAKPGPKPAPDQIIMGESSNSPGSSPAPSAAPNEDAATDGDPDEIIIGESSNSPAPTPRGQAREANAGPERAPDQNGPDLSEKSGELIFPQDPAHAQAVLYADTLVKQSNPDFDPSSRSSFLRSRGMMRLFNQFSSAISLFASRNHYMLTAAAKGKIGKGRYARHLAYDFLFPAACLFLFYGLIRDFHDKKGQPVKSFTGLLMDQLSMALPIFGTLASDMGQNLMGMGSGNYRRGDIRVSLDAPVELVKNSSIAANRLLSGKNAREEQKAAIYALLDLASFFARLPVSKVMRKAERGYEQYKRGEGTPASILLPKPGK